MILYGIRQKLLFYYLQQLVNYYNINSTHTKEIKTQLKIHNLFYKK